MVISTKSPKNQIGRLYAESEKAEKLAFRSSLLKTGKLDGINYVKRFQDSWQFAERIGSMPYCIVFAAIEHLGFDPTTLNTNESK